ncbi:MAG: hypothetical protein ONB48_10765 [candidate division KSB1 bacterium]|nr:hypothetical protein [candidate division KSB1 bacterium]MDZ7275563.1 hypothetical protein [candidate division KSB1 bacterium]MDZ7286125.1 hypothetical protein [candidate division KSB1 bacterium]MDZ7296351.1 hypothetical protein [candidate division KSB1 bacterium]MDZ7307127.1 hypothetical protein [candidate division KSB1 bacterium]
MQKYKATLQVRRLILTAIFIALTVAGGLLFFAVPGVEVVTATVFLAGFMLGVTRGLLVGGIAEFLYTFFNPLGPAIPPLMLAQVAGMAVSGLAGGCLARLFPDRLPPVPAFAVAGMLLTLLFDFATTLAFGLSINQTWEGLLAALTFGAPVYLTHLATNGLIFTLLVPILARHLLTLTVFQAAAGPRFAAATRNAQPANFTNSQSQP